MCPVFAGRCGAALGNWQDLEQRRRRRELSRLCRRPSDIPYWLRNIGRDLRAQCEAGDGNCRSPLKVNLLHLLRVEGALELLRTHPRPILRVPCAAVWRICARRARFRLCQIAHPSRLHRQRSARARHMAGQGPSGRCRSSVVEHSLGKGEVLSSILSGSTIKAGHSRLCP